MVSAPGCSLLHGETHAKGARRAHFALLPLILWPQPSTPSLSQLPSCCAVRFQLGYDGFRNFTSLFPIISGLNIEHLGLFHQKMYTYRYLHPCRTCVTLRKLKRRACHLRALIGALLGKSKLWLQLCGSAFQGKAPMDIMRWVIGHVSIESTEPPRSIALQSKTSLMSSFTKIHKHCLLSNQRCRDHGSLFWLAVLGAFSWICIPAGAICRQDGNREFSSADNPKSHKTSSRALHTACTSPGFSPLVRVTAHTRNFANN